MNNPTLRKGIPVIIRASADLWRNYTEAEREEWREARSREIHEMRASGVDEGTIMGTIMDGSGEPRMAPRTAYRRATAGEFTVVRARKVAPMGYHTVPSCCVLRDADGVEWYARRRDVHPLVEVKPTESKAKATVKTDMDRHIESFVAEVQTMRDDHDRLSVELLWDAAVSEGHTRLTNITVTWGRKYAKLTAMSTRGGNRGGSVYCFVNRENGDILKAANWKAPAKHARGNVTGLNRMKAVGPHGARYLR